MATKPDLTLSQKATLRKLRMMGPVVLVREVTASALIRKGYAQQERPPLASATGIYLRLTKKGEKSA